MDESLDEKIDNKLRRPMTSDNKITFKKKSQPIANTNLVSQMERTQDSTRVT